MGDRNRDNDYDSTCTYSNYSSNKVATPVNPNSGRLEDAFDLGAIHSREVEKPLSPTVFDSRAMIPNEVFKNHETKHKPNLEVAAKLDEGKADWSLLPVDAVEEILKVLEFGKNKYEAHNWCKGNGFKWTRPFNACLRHLFAWARGEDKDPESGISHLAHVGCNVLFLLHFILNKERYNQDDRYKTK